MKKIILTIKAIITITILFGQQMTTPPIPANPRLCNINYMQTKLFDDFSGSNLDPYKWSPNVGAKENQFNIFVNDPLYIKTENGILQLIARSTPNVTANIQLANGQWTTETRNYTSGEVGTNLKYNYGSYESRCLFPDVRSTSLAFWSYGGDGIPCPQGGGNASEIDFAELVNRDSSPTLDFVFHGWYNTGNGTTVDYYNILPNLYHENDVDFSNWHVYKAIWTPYSVKFYIDGVEKWKRTRFSLNGTDVDMENLQSGQTYNEHAWFPHWVQQVILSNQVIANLTNLPVTASFDYVNIKEFFLAPEITCPTVICSTGTATMDVATEATNISWALTPSNLFSGATNGSGTTANIVRASVASGLGKITYSFQMPSGETFTASKDIWIGTYSSSNYPITGPSSAPCRQYVYYSIPALEGVTAINWVWPSGWTYVSGQNTPNLALQTGTTGSGGTVAVQATNLCGASGSYATKYTSVTGICGYSLFVSPNPASSETTIEIINDDPEKQAASIEWDLEVYDPGQILKEKIQKIKDKKYKLNTQGWKDGVYIVHALIDGESISEKLIVKH